MEREEERKMEDFLEKFNFRKEKELFIGTEREFHLADHNGKIIPIAPQVLKQLNSPKNFGYELSACQIENQVGPCNLKYLKHELLEHEAAMKKLERKLNFQRLYFEVGPDNMPLDIYPDPTGRYQKITKNMPRLVLLAACQVIATHIHIGMPNHEVALAVYNKAIQYFDELCDLGDGSNGKRLEIYRIMAPDCTPNPYYDWNHFYSEALTEGFAEDPHKCWDLIRISVHGTIEFRMFGATNDLDKIVDWAAKCHQICEKGLEQATS